MTHIDATCPGRRVGSVTVPEVLWITSIVASRHCRLRAVLGQAGVAATFPRLADGPEAVAGSILHRAEELAFRDWVAGDPAEAFDDYVAAAATAVDWPLYAPLDLPTGQARIRWLRSVLSFPEWMRRRGPFVRSVERMLLRPSPQRRAQPLAPRVDSVAPALERVRGIPDRIRTENGVTVVTEFKSGNATSDAEFQLRLYGLLVSAGASGRRVRLELVDQTGCRDVAFEVGDVADELAHALSDLPVGEQAAHGLARPGPTCRTCAFRPACSAYIAIAPSWWRSHPDHAVPADTWGKVLQDPAPDGRAANENLVRAVLLDAAQRKVAVRFLDISRPELQQIHPGDTVAFFGLEPMALVSGLNGRHVHPHNFRDRDPNRPSARAWSLLCLRA